MRSLWARTSFHALQQAEAAVLRRVVDANGARSWTQRFVQLPPVKALVDPPVKPPCRDIAPREADPTLGSDLHPVESLAELAAAASTITTSARPSRAASALASLTSLLNLSGSGGGGGGSSATTASSSPPLLHVNTVIMGAIDAPPLVLVHGYGAAVGLWYKNLAPLAAHFRVYAIDLLGFGRSSRPAFPFRENEPEVGETFFVESMEEWRKRLALPNAHFLGHSFGGYVSTAYAERYPDRVRSLILASPFGVPDAEWRTRFNVRSRKSREMLAAELQAKLIAEATSASPAHSSPHPPPHAAHVAHAAPTTPAEAEAAAAALARRIREAPTGERVFEYMWESGVTPQAMLRAFGPLARRVVDRIMDRRFGPRMTASEKQLIGEYVYHLWLADASAERALQPLFEPFGWARRPLLPRLRDPTRIRTPTHMLYGDFDWMDRRPAEAVLAARENPFLRSVDVLERAGHQLAIDNPTGFNDYVIAKVTAEERAFRAARAV